MLRPMREENNPFDITWIHPESYAVATSDDAGNVLLERPALASDLTALAPNRVTGSLEP